MNVRPYEPHDESALIALWQSCGLTRPWNPPERDIAEKLEVQPELFLVMTDENKLIGSLMGAYDGHRGVVNYLAIAPDYQGQGLGRLLMQEIETRLKAMNCPKINLMIRTDNTNVQNFYAELGYEPQDCVVYGKWL